MKGMARMKKRLWCFVLLLALTIGCIGCNKPRISLRYHAQTDMAIDGIYGFSEGRIIAVDRDDFFLVDIDGNRVGEKTYNFIYPFNANKQALALSDGTWVFINDAGQIVEPAAKPAENLNIYIYDSSETTGVKSDQGDYLFGVQSGKDGKYLTEPIFEWISSLSNTLNYAILAEGEHRAVMISPAGEVKVTLPDDCRKAVALDDHIICAFDDGDDLPIYCLADSNGKILNETAFDSISNFENGLAVITTGDKMGLIDTKGTVVLEPSLSIDPVTDLHPYISGNHIAWTKDGKLIVAEIVTNN